MKKIAIIYGSSSGKTEAVAKIIKKNWKDSMLH
jgi:flavodoxin